MPRWTIHWNLGSGCAPFISKTMCLPTLRTWAIRLPVSNSSISGTGVLKVCGLALSQAESIRWPRTRSLTPLGDGFYFRQLGHGTNFIVAEAAVLESMAGLGRLIGGGGNAPMFVHDDPVSAGFLPDRGPSNRISLLFARFRDKGNVDGRGCPGCIRCYGMHTRIVADGEGERLRVGEFLLGAGDILRWRP